MTGVPWTHPPGFRGETLNFVTGCSRVSAGCGDATGGGCYAEALAGGTGLLGLKKHPRYKGLTRQTAAGPRWTGEVRLHADLLAKPYRWRKPRCVFAPSMGDLFHTGVPFGFIAAWFGVMAACPQHRFLILTKRPERAVEFFEWIARQDGGPNWAMANAGTEYGVPTRWAGDGPRAWPWPLPNAGIGVSAEDQKSADGRIPLLLQIPATMRFVSVEPQLGAVDLDLSGYLWGGRDDDGREADPLDWVIQGGESGPSARPFDIDWAHSLRAQCGAAVVPYFFKQDTGFQPGRQGRAGDDLWAAKAWPRWWLR